MPKYQNIRYEKFIINITPSFVSYLAQCVQVTKSLLVTTHG